MDYTVFISQLFIIIAVLTAIVNIATEVCKVTFEKISGSKTINIFVVIISVFLTVATFLAYWQIKGLEIAWYLILAFIVIGILVAYSAMFGYDKLLKYFENIGASDSGKEITGDKSQEG